MADSKFWGDDWQYEHPGAFAIQMAVLLFVVLVTTDAFSSAGVTATSIVANLIGAAVGGALTYWFANRQARKAAVTRPETPAGGVTPGS